MTTPAPPITIDEVIKEEVLSRDLQLDKFLALQSAIMPVLQENPDLSAFLYKYQDMIPVLIDDELNEALPIDQKLRSLYKENFVFLDAIARLNEIQIGGTFVSYLIAEYREGRTTLYERFKAQRSGPVVRVVSTSVQTKPTQEITRPTSTITGFDLRKNIKYISTSSGKVILPPEGSIDLFQDFSESWISVKGSPSERLYIQLFNHYGGHSISVDHLMGTGPGQVMSARDRSFKRWLNRVFSGHSSSRVYRSIENEIALSLSVSDAKDTQNYHLVPFTRQRRGYDPISVICDTGDLKAAIYQAPTDRASFLRQFFQSRGPASNISVSPDFDFGVFIRHFGNQNAITGWIERISGQVDGYAIVEVPNKARTLIVEPISKIPLGEGIVYARTDNLDIKMEGLKESFLYPTVGTVLGMDAGMGIAFVASMLPLELSVMEPILYGTAGGLSGAYIGARVAQSKGINNILGFVVGGIVGAYVSSFLGNAPEAMQYLVAAVEAGIIGYVRGDVKAAMETNPNLIEEIDRKMSALGLDEKVKNYGTVVYNNSNLPGVVVVHSEKENLP